MHFFIEWASSSCLGFLDKLKNTFGFLCKFSFPLQEFPDVQKPWWRSSFGQAPDIWKSRIDRYCMCRNEWHKRFGVYCDLDALTPLYNIVWDMHVCLCLRQTKRVESTIYVLMKYGRVFMEVILGEHKSFKEYLVLFWARKSVNRYVNAVIHCNTPIYNDLDF